MGREFDGRSILVDSARTIGTFGYVHHLNGSDILHGLKVSRIVGLYGKGGSKWLWRIFDGVVGDFGDLSKDRIFEPALLILDLRYRILEDRTEVAFHQTNDDFLSNCIRCVRFRHGFLNPRRYLSIRRAKILHGLFESNGFGFWQGNGDRS